MRVWPFLLAALVLALLLSGAAAAAPPSEDETNAGPVIPPGQEPAVQALLVPLTLGDAIEQAPGWTFHSFELRARVIVLRLAGPREASASIELAHPDFGPADARRSRGFAISTPDAPVGSEAALAAVIALIEANDEGSFWAVRALEQPVRSEPPPEPVEPEPSWDDISHELGKVGRLWWRDGLLTLAAVIMTLLVLTAIELREASARVRGGLALVVVSGALLRLLLAPEVALAPWPFTRQLISARLIFEGPGLAQLQASLGLGRVWFDDVTTTSNLVYAILAPLAVYVHARNLLDDQRAALIAAAVMAFLPLHIRFSRSDVAFIPSIVLSSTSFALCHMARKPSALGGWIALAALGLPLSLGFLVRPLNLLYAPLLIAAGLVDEGLQTTKPALQRPRFVAVALVTLGAAALVGIPHLRESYAEDVSAGLSLETLLDSLRVLISPRLNILFNPVFTPPGLSALAVWGALDLHRRGHRRLLAFLLVWLGLFFLGHGYAVPDSMYMQARYHLHLVVPFTLLVACGAEAGLRMLAKRSDTRATMLRWAAIAYVLASPLIHLHAIRNVDLNDMREWIFVHQHRDSIPAECTVLEYTGAIGDSRFERVGYSLDGGVQVHRWPVINLTEPPEEGPTISAEQRELLLEPRPCLIWYESLPCVGDLSAVGPRAETCTAISEMFEFEAIASESFESRPYDRDLAIGASDVEVVDLGLYRVRPRE